MISDSIAKSLLENFNYENCFSNICSPIIRENDVHNGKVITKYSLLKIETLLVVNYTSLECR